VLASLHGADDERFLAGPLPTTAPFRLDAADLRLVDLDDAAKPVTLWPAHRPTPLLQHDECRLVAAEAKLPLQLQR
jgi:hypothetical protein